MMQDRDVLSFGQAGGRMGLFNARRPESPRSAEPANQIPITQFDLGKRYDVYVMETAHDGLYENVRFVCIRTFHLITEYSSGLLGGLLDMESADGSRCIIPYYSIRLICEHGTQPAF